MGNTFIYILLCPETNEIRYVGKTYLTVRERLVQHLRLAKHPEKSSNLELYKWILGLLRKEVFPIIRQIDCVSDQEAFEMEAYYYNLYVKDYPLLNKRVLYQGGCLSEFNIPELRLIVKENKIKLKVLAEVCGASTSNISGFLNGSITSISREKASLVNSYLRNI